MKLILSSLNRLLVSKNIITEAELKKFFDQEIKKNIKDKKPKLKCQKGKTCPKQPNNVFLSNNTKFCNKCDKPQKDKKLC